MSTVASEENREMLFMGNVFYKYCSDISTLMFWRPDLPKIADINPQQEATLSPWKKLVPRETAEMEARSLSTPKVKVAGKLKKRNHKWA